MECYGCQCRKARKQHKCEECRGTIAVGEVYNYHHGVLDGTGVSYKVCTDCETLRDDINKAWDVAGTDEQVPFTALYESVFEAHDRERWIPRYLANCRKRGAPIAEWMVKRESQLLQTATA